MQSLLERYEKIAVYLANAEENEMADGRKMHRWLYSEMGLDDVRFDKSGFEHLRSKLNRDVVSNVKIMLEWEDFYIYVKTRPSYPHKHTKSCLDAPLILWLFNMGNGDVDASQRMGSAGNTYLC